MPPEEPDRARSPIKVVGVDLALTLIMIALALIAVRMLMGDRPKDIADTAQVAVTLDAVPPCFVPRWSSSGSARTTVTAFPEGNRHQKGLQRIFLVGLKGDGSVRCELRLETLKGCSSQASVEAAAMAIVGSPEIMKDVEYQTKNGGGELTKVIDAFGEIIRAGKENNKDRFSKAESILRPLLFNIQKHIFWIPTNPGRIQPPVPGLAASSYICYRMDRIARQLGFQQNEYAPMYQAYVDQPLFSPSIHEQLAIVLQLDQVQGRSANLQNRQAAIDQAKSQAAYVAFLTRNTVYLDNRLQFLKALDDFYAGKQNGAPLTADFLLHDGAKSDYWIGYLLAKEVLVLFSSETHMTVKIEAMASGDGKRSNHQIAECRQIPVNRLVGATKAVATIRFSKDRPSRIEWSAELAPKDCPAGGAP